MKAGQNPACKSIQGGCKLASGDILVTADSELDKEKLQKSAEWVTVVAQSAKTAIKMNKHKKRAMEKSKLAKNQGTAQDRYTEDTKVSYKRRN